MVTKIVYSINEIHRPSWSDYDVQLTTYERRGGSSIHPGDIDVAEKKT